jgi:integrase
VNQDEKLQAFEAWLREEQFAGPTIENSVRAARQILTVASAGEDLPAWLAPYGRRMLVAERQLGWAWPADVKRALKALDTRVGEAKRTPKAARAAARRREKRQELPYDDASWERLYAAVGANDTPEAAVLDVMIATGLRVGDVLRLEWTALVEGRRTGLIRLAQKGGGERVLPWKGAPDTWRHLEKVWSAWDPHDRLPTVAHLVSPDGDGSALAGHAAYKRIHEALRRLAKELKLPGRAHPHRLRRTVIVQALTTTGDVELARDLAGHASIVTTSRYTKHTRPDVVAQIQQQLAAKRRGNEEGS